MPTAPVPDQCFPPSLPLPERLARLLSEGRPVSRNRDFALFEGPEGRRLLRTLRLVQSLERDLAGSGVQARLSPVDAHTWEVRLTLPVGTFSSGRTATRTARLPSTLVELLRGRPGPLGALLAGGSER